MNEGQCSRMNSWNGTCCPVGCLKNIRIKTRLYLMQMTLLCFLSLAHISVAYDHFSRKGDKKVRNGSPNLLNNLNKKRPIKWRSG